MFSDDMRLIAQQMVAPGKGILAADESTGTMEKRLHAVGLDSTAEVRRQYRELIVSTPDLGSSVSGVILFDETVRQDSSSGVPLRKIAEQNGVLPGIKVDKGAKPLAGTDGEKITEGLDGLRDRLAEYAQLGMKFTKWRAVLDIGAGRPSDYAIHANAHALARYAALSQEAGLVPMVEPEVLMDGDHSLAAAEEATTRALRRVFAELAAQHVELESMVLKPNMVVAGKDHGTQPSPTEVAEATVRTLKRTVPAAVPGIAFLSGGQGDEEATVNLNAINQLGPLPWQVTFSFGRGLLAPALQEWVGRDEKFDSAQQVLAHRAKLNGAACEGRYEAQLEHA
ncbi:fructose-bisphosphate aldolase class I [Actinopolyspora erythraea]|uniref:Probable fructose-bisphosphate aldolase class 1 n=1 Tax=Actinopolyspora erythraea TaxID=414996 RepID=A0A099D6J6_9ACTN|nr:class I fructose-bisphosphate aldolase [Actinopolyspora erythraea]ASU78762.1 fructose-bisphosphate aldolase class I [Actinopolyspora erythraea]KGI81516.1 fructose-bisphosphate aldolase [Actinopolyspora erythraea]